VLTHASIGIATAVDTGCDGQELLQNADLALYTAKSAGKSRWELFEPAMYAAVQHRHRLKADLYHAMESVEFELVYQPIVRVSTCSIVGAEALLRWRHPTRGTVLPDDFISLVEETGLITQVGAWVMRSACEEARDWPVVDGAEPIAVTVNVAIRQLREPDFVDSVREVLRDTGLPAHRLILEVTEADIINDTDSILECLNGVRDLGVRIALDDFGTGHSSLSRLREFPVDVLKIDRSFTASLCGPTQSVAFAHSVFSFGVSLGLSVIAEGVETEECLHALQDLGCELAQGFLFGQPLPPLAMRRLLARELEVPTAWMPFGATPVVAATQAR
jgi:EAL domain-containing protein (putative c-di-GMP-specific phosphodiesterase class I)